MTQAPKIEIRPAVEHDRAIATLVMGFSSDPILRWVLPDPDRYLTYWPQFIRAQAGEAFTSETADTTDDGAGVALWLPPGVGPDEEAMATIAEEAVPAADQDEVFSLMGQMTEFHPTEPHWYLPMIAVDVTKYGLGLGSALLRHGLHRCDRDQLPAYLEATSARSKALYERHGFEEVGVMQFGSSPPMWPMLRRPSPATSLP